MIGKVAAFRAHAYVPYLYFLPFRHRLGCSPQRTGPYSPTHRSQASGTHLHRSSCVGTFPSTVMKPFEFALTHPSKGACCVGPESTQHLHWERLGGGSCSGQQNPVTFGKKKPTQKLQSPARKLLQEPIFSSSSTALPVPARSSGDLTELLPPSGTCPSDTPACFPPRLLPFSQQVCPSTLQAPQGTVTLILTQQAVA